MSVVRQGRTLFRDHPILIVYAVVSGYCSFAMFLVGGVLVKRGSIAFGVVLIAAGVGVQLVSWIAGEARIRGRA
jgi:Zn-dependent membrane protease YugP